ncbi:MAG TPA: rod-binding protein [Planctomycetota bacterium]|nr:rod-binding protein [Planctomycetota bacterium]
MIQGLVIPADARTLAVSPPRQAYALDETVASGQDDLEKQVGRFVSGTFFGMMLKAMRDTVSEDGLMSGGRGEHVFRGMFDMELTERFSESSNFPLIEAAVRQLSGRAVYRKQMPHRVGDPAISKADGGRP